MIHENYHMSTYTVCDNGNRRQTEFLYGKGNKFEEDYIKPKFVVLLIGNKLIFWLEAKSSLANSPWLTPFQPESRSQSDGGERVMRHSKSSGRSRNQLEK
jgi:hypothetical protein